MIRAPDGRFAMIDAGLGSPLRQLARLGVEELALVVATHAHADHIGGLDDVLTARPVDTYLDNGTPHSTNTYLELMAHLERLDVRYLQAVPRTLLLGDVSLEILPMPPTTVEQNDRSVGVLLRFGDFSALLTGDSERDELDYWLRQNAIQDVTLLKAPHHGAASGFTYGFLEVAQPEVVVISVGNDNPYAHPRPEALAAYTSFADRVYRTDRGRDGHGNGVPRRPIRRGVRRGAGPSGRSPWTRSPHLRRNRCVLPPLMTRRARGPWGSRGFSRSRSIRTKGDDRDNLNDEYVVIENRSRTRLGIGLWRLCDLSSRCFRFPPGASIAAGRRAVVYSGYGSTDGVSFFMNNSRSVWNNNGDEATLFDGGGNTIVRYVYEEE